MHRALLQTLPAVQRGSAPLLFSFSRQESSSEMPSCSGMFSSEKSEVRREQEIIRQSMKIPNDAVMVWQYADSFRKSDGSKASGIARVGQSAGNILVIFEYKAALDSSPVIITLRRPLREKFTKTLEILKKKVILKSKEPIPLDESNAVVIRIRGISEDQFAWVTNKDVLYGDQVTGFTINRTEYRLVRDAPDCATLKIHLVTKVGYPLMASFDMKHGYEGSVSPIFHWYTGPESLSAVPPELLATDETGLRKYAIRGWTHRYTGNAYIPTKEDIDKRICVLMDVGEDTIVRCALADGLVEDALNEPLIFEKRQVEHCRRPPHEGFRVISYNILADLYLDLGLKQEELFFPYCPKEFQKYSYRYPLLLREITGYNADLIALQEVDVRFHKRYLAHWMESFDYETCFTKKGLLVNEGLAMCFSRVKFKLHGLYDRWLPSLLNLDEYPENEDVMQFLEKCQRLKDRFISRPAVIQLMSLESVLYPEQMILVANTHLHFDPRHENVKALQALLCARYIARVSRSLQKKNPNMRIHHLFSGDFNSTVDSGTYELLSRGGVSKDHECWKCEENVSADFAVWKDFERKDALKFVSLAGDPPVTNYTKFSKADGTLAGFAGCIDYIWGSPSLKVLSIIPMPCKELVTKYTALPSKIAPSDHIPLICDVSFDC